MKVGDFVKVFDREIHDPPHILREGLITDCFEDDNGFWMYEVTSFDPPGRAWFPDLSLTVVKKES